MFAHVITPVVELNEEPDGSDPVSVYVTGSVGLTSSSCTSYVPLLPYPTVNTMMREYGSPLPSPVFGGWMEPPVSIWNVRVSELNSESVTVTVMSPSPLNGTVPVHSKICPTCVAVIHDGFESTV